jgi:hypothetical protein
MNLDFALVNRALQNIGQAPITEADREADNVAWRTAKDYYLSTMLESLAQVEWTSAKRRRMLFPTQKPHKRNSDFRYTFDAPIDCVKPVELDSQVYYEMESCFIYSNERYVRLLYITNGKRLIDQTSLSAGNAFRRRNQDYFTGGNAGRIFRYESGDNIVTGGNAERPDPIPPKEAEEDFPEYEELRLEPLFYLYWEKMLSSKYAMRITDKPDLHLAFFNEAQLAGQAAADTSVAQAAARKKAPQTWTEELGLSSC